MVPETWINHVEVEATDRRAAMIAACNGDGECIELEYFHVQDPDIDIFDSAPVPKDIPGAWFVEPMEEKMSKDNIDKANDAKRYLEDAEDSGREAKKLFEEIGDPDGVKKASTVEREAREAKEYVEKRVGRGR
jgi:hypothetical protein